MNRELTHDEVAALAHRYVGIPRAEFERACEPFIVADEAGELHIVEWSTENMITFLLLASRCGLPN